MKALVHIHYNCPPAKTERASENVNILCKQVKSKDMPCSLEIVPVTVVVRFSYPRIRIRSNNALDATALRLPTIPSTRSAHLRPCGIRRGLSSCIPSPKLVGNGTCASTRVSCCFLLLESLDDLVFVIIGGGMR